MERRNSNCDKCNIKLKGNGAYSLQYLGKTYWLCGHCMNGIVKREILTSEPENDFVTPICEEDVVEITGKTLLEHKVICRKEGALKELEVIKDEVNLFNNGLVSKFVINPDFDYKYYINERIKELKK